MILIGKGKLSKGRYGIRLIPKNLILCVYAEGTKKNGETELKWKDLGHFGNLSSLIESLLYKEIIETKAKTLSKLITTQMQFIKSIEVDDIVKQLQKENNELKIQLTKALKELKEKENNELSN